MTSNSSMTASYRMCLSVPHVPALRNLMIEYTCKCRRMLQNSETKSAAYATPFSTCYVRKCLASSFDSVRIEWASRGAHPLRYVATTCLFPGTCPFVASKRRRDPCVSKSLLRRCDYRPLLRSLVYHIATQPNTHHASNSGTHTVHDIFHRK